MERKSFTFTVSIVNNMLHLLPKLCLKVTIEQKSNMSSILDCTQAYTNTFKNSFFILRKHFTAFNGLDIQKFLLFFS